MTTYLSIDNVVYNENDTQAVFTISVTGGAAAASDIVIDLQRATPSSGGVIYTTSLGSVTMLAGATQVQFTVPLTTLTAPGFMVRLSTDTEGVVLTENTAVAVVQDGATAAAATPTFSARDVVVDEGAGTVTIQYMLDAPSSTDVSLNYATHSLTAFAGEDFGGAAGTISIAAGQTHGTLVLPLYTDGRVEGREVFAVSFGNPAGVTIEDPVVHVAVADQDTAGGPVARPSVHVFGNVAYEDQGYVEFVIALDQPSTNEVRVDFDTNPVAPPAATPGQAVEGTDYVRHNGTVVFSPGEVLKTVRVLLLDNPTSGSTTQFQQFWVSLSVFGADHEVSNTRVTMLNREYYDANPSPQTLTIEQLIASEAGVVVAGTERADVLNGGSGPDLLNGRGGADTMTGGLGDDTYIVDHAGDLVVELADQGNDTVISYLGGAQTLLANTENLVLASLTDMNVSATGNAQDNLLVGNAGNNRLEGLDGRDTLEGSAGNDTLIGGRGDDVYGVDSLGDVVTELAGEGNDTIRAWISYSLTSGSNVENLELAGRENIDATGDANANVLTGNIGHNVLDGGGGQDMLFGGDGNDTLTGGLGNDSMAGGSGDDTYNVDAAGDVVVELAGEGNDALYATVAYTLTAGAHIERAYLSGTATSLTGNELDNALFGGVLNDNLSGAAGNDTLDGGAGNDTLAGGGGDDTYVVDAAGDVVTEASGAGIDQVDTALASYALGSNVENLTYTGAAAFNGTGNALDNRLTGGAGNDTLNGGEGDDTLDGGAGTDSLVGGAGNDTYLVDSLTDVLVDASGIDTVQTGLTYTLATGIENLQLTGGASLAGTGNAGDNLLTGNAGNNTLSGLEGNDTLEGGAGNDTLIGGAGNDTYIVDSTTDTITELAGEGTDTVRSSVSFSVADLAHVEHVTLTGAAAIDATGNDAGNGLTGNDAANRLSGGLGNDALVGAGGHDTLDGGAGNDSMWGGQGDDVYLVDSALDVVSEAVGAGNDSIRASVDYVLAAGQSIESLTLVGTATSLTGNELANNLTGGALADSLAGLAGDDSLAGASGNDTLLGGEGHDTLNGGTGVDSMVGGTGDDLYWVDSADDIVVESAGEGFDRIWSSANYVLGAGVSVESMTLMGAATSLTGNALDNALFGAGLADTLSGLAGNDSLNGGTGNDTLVGGEGNDVLDGGAGADSLVGGSGDDLYIVDASGDVIVELEGEGVDTVQTGLSWSLGGLAHVENVTLTGGAAVNATGNDAANVLTGNSSANQLGGGAGNDTLLAGAGADTLDGGAGTDSMVGGMGDDLYRVDSAGDVIVEVAGEGNDRIWATANYTLGAGVSVETMTLLGTATSLTGNELANTLNGGSLNDLLSGMAGNDSLSGGAGNDTLLGGEGHDTLNGGVGGDRMEGGAGDDLYYADSADDVVLEVAGGGNDRIWASVNYTLGAGVSVETLSVLGSANALTGNELANVIYGGSLNDSLSGMDGNDTISSVAGNDLLDGGAGNDSLDAGVGTDTLLGGAGDDTLIGGTGTDSMVGGVGDDLYYVDAADDVIVEQEGEGSDRIWASANYTLGTGVSVEKLSVFGTASALTGNELANILNGGSLADTLSGMGGHDSLIGAGGNDTLLGGEGNDTLNGGAGADSMVGGAGDDLYWVDSASDLVVEAAGEGTDRIWTSANYTLAAGVSVESMTLMGAATSLTGNELANSLWGSGQADTLSGMAGNDNLNGAAGNDSLQGGLGNDTLAGGAGADHFVFDTALNATTNVDVVTDFVAGDLIVLDNDVFTALGAAGSLSAGAFYSGAGLTGGSVAGQGGGVYYDTTTGNLYYDADGFGNGASVQFATLGNKAGLTAASFLVGE